MPSPLLDATELKKLERLEHRHLWRLPLFASLYVGAAAGLTVLAVSPSWPWGLKILAGAPLALLAAASLHAVSLFTHEGVHGVLLPHPLANRLLAAMCAWPVLQTFSAYRVLHLRHHLDLGGAQDPDHYPNYTPRSWLVTAMNWGRLLLGYPAYVCAIPFLGFRRGSATDRAWILAELAALGTLVALAMASPLPRDALVFGWLIPMGLINTMVNVRGMSQHTLLPEATDAIRGTRSILTRPLVAFFMCNENLHLEHHLYPRVPWYQLPALHQRLRPQLALRGAPYIPSYASFVREFVRAQLGLRG